MSKYIDADALVAKIINTPSKIARTAQTTVEITMLADRQNEILDVIDAFPATDVEPVRRWISCNERLPDVGVEVLAYKRWEGVLTHRIYTEIEIAWLTNDGTWWAPSGYPVSGSVIAWMPLPEPPKMDGGSE